MSNRIARHMADADRSGNTARLQGLPAPSVAHLDMAQHGADCDGLLEWTVPVTAWRSTGVPVLGAHVLHGAITAAGEGVYKIWDIPVGAGLAFAEEAVPKLLAPFIERVPRV